MLIIQYQTTKIVPNIYFSDILTDFLYISLTLLTSFYSFSLKYPKICDTTQWHFWFCKLKDFTSDNSRKMHSESFIIKC